MHDASEGPLTPEEIRNSLIGLGEYSIRKSYYPQLRKRLRDLERFRALLDGSSDAVMLIDVSDGTVVDTNSAAKRLFTALDSAPLPAAIGMIMPPAAIATIREALSANVPGDLPPIIYRDETRTDGRVYEFMLNRIVLDGTTFAIAVARDITDRIRLEQDLRTSLEEQHVLIKEINHRVKNNFQITQSLLHLQLEELEDPVARIPLIDAENRIAAMASVHEKLYQSPDLAHIEFDSYLVELSSSIILSYEMDARRIRLSIQTSPLVLELDKAVPCGLILNELVTNAVRHAYPKPQSGTIFITLRSDADRCELVVSDDGIGLPAGFTIQRASGLGLKLVDTLTKQIGGTMSIGTGEDGKGTTIHIEFFQRSKERA